MKHYASVNYRGILFLGAANEQSVSRGDIREIPIFFLILQTITTTFSHSSYPGEGSGESETLGFASAMMRVFLFALKSLISGGIHVLH